MAYKDPEKKKAQQRRRYEKHRDEIIASSAQWVKDHPEQHQEWYKGWIAENREQHNADSRQYYYNHKDQALDNQAEWRRKNPDKKKAQSERYRMKNKEKRREAGRKYHQDNSEKHKAEHLYLRLIVLEAYDNECACCGEKNLAFLTIDHIFNDGAEDRDRAGTNLYKRLRSQGYPKDRFRILCYNCNIARARNGGVCPHKSDTKESLSIKSLAWKYNKTVVTKEICSECGEEKEYDFILDRVECKNGCDFDFDRSLPDQEEWSRRSIFAANDEVM